jgi:predicted Fe-Mo cluster-binding NifX family protein
MLSQVPRSHATSWTAVTVMDGGSDPMLCPFFGKCDGLLLIDADSGRKKFLPNEHRTAVSFCQLVVKASPDRLICGFIGEPEKRNLQAAGIDVRLGSLTYSVDELVACFCDLPAA